MEHDVSRPATGKLILGVFIILAGVLFTLESFGVTIVRHVWDFWPLILVGIGASHLVRPGGTERIGGWILLGLGIVFLLRNFHLIHFSIGQLIPLVLVLVGIRIVVTALGRGRQGGIGLGGSDGSYLNDWVAFGGIERRVTSQEFRGGDLAAFCGGFDIDLRQAAIAGEEARIDVFAWWGGGDIKVPADWEVAVSVIPLFGGYDDKTSHPVVEEGKPRKRLVITGTVVMGGLGVQN
jgi:predicted membrane protein